MFPASELAQYLVITLPVRVDVTNTQELLSAFADAPTGPVALDMSATQTVDSTALGAIVTIYKRLRARGDDLVLVDLGEGVRRVLALTRLDRVFSIVPSLHSLDTPAAGARQSSVTGGDAEASGESDSVERVS